ncbi:hypothetical protein LTR85_006952 [Meristemomyces frigidus]|nr:hypothetical protein LTR85_006952 [Meristemomyces frigidus]
MGHYAAEDEQTIRTANARIPVFQAFKEHCSGTRTNTELAVLEAIREIHSDKHITRVLPSSCDLLGFAKAGHASAHLTTSGDSLLSIRSYQTPGSRLEGGEGTLGDSVSFGHYEYKYHDRDLPFYSIQWDEQTRGVVKLYYILSPKEGVDDSGLHSASADSLITACGKWTSELHEEIYVFDSGRWQKNRELWSAVQTSSWDDVILDPAMKETLINDVHGFFDSRAVYEEYAVPWKRGIIFHGTPGCGKTISIKALMNTLQPKNVASLYVKSFDACQGLQYSIRTIFAQARAMAPCLLIFEDLDSLVRDEVRSYFLNEVDGLEDNNGILMIGSTNHLERLDPGISKRPSRFDRKYHYKLPSEQERILYCQYWQRKLQTNSKVEFSDELNGIVAKLTEGFSFAYMKELFVQALLAIVGGRADVEDEVNDLAVEKTAEETTVTAGSAKLTKEGEATATGGAAAEDAFANDVERKVPEVDIPDHLKSNPLLRILQKQVTALVNDMDNTKDDVHEKVSKPKISAGGRAPANRRRGG